MNRILKYMDLDLKAIFEPSLVFINEQLNTIDAVFDFVAQKLISSKIIRSLSAKELKTLLLERESISSTGIGQGIALPHVLVPELNRIVAVVVKNPLGIEWEAIDGKPVKLIIVLLSPPTMREKYLKYLAEIANALSEPVRFEKILKSHIPEEIYHLLTKSPKENIFRKYTNFWYFGVGLLFFLLLSVFTFHRLKLPDTDFYRQLNYLRFNESVWISREILSTVLFFAMVLGTLLFFRYRVAFACGALSILLLSGVLDIKTTVEFMSIPTILFIVAVMILVKWFESKGLFRYFVIKVLKNFLSKPVLLYAVLMFLSAILAGFVDEVSAILITLGIGIELSHYARFNIVPFLLGLVMATNIGSTLTLIGNPIGIYIAFAGKLTFFDFLRNSTILSFICAVIIILIIVIYHRKNLKEWNKISYQEVEKDFKSISAQELSLAAIIFGVFVLAVVSHSFLEQLLHVEDKTVLLAAVLGLVGFVVLYEEERGRYFIEKGPDWWTILYFMFLFANAACLEYTGVTAKLAFLLTEAARIIPVNFLGPLKESVSILTLLLWGSAGLSGFVDNLPIVAALVPVVRDLQIQGITGASLYWWSLLLGACFGGNLTMIGSTANLVAIGVYEKSFRKRFYFKEWLKLGILVTFISLLIANVFLLLRLQGLIK
jgi:Na+/H+ antiporter NhaD/arsenite permease-like protein/mannitol/fructose-specific phosphotransferase system IIA component (Ntr-type)